MWNLLTQFLFITLSPILINPILNPILINPLQNKRTECITKLEHDFKERFLQELLEAKELEREKVRIRQEKIEAERAIRYEQIIAVSREHAFGIEYYFL